MKMALVEKRNMTQYRTIVVLALFSSATCSIPARGESDDVVLWQKAKASVKAANPIDVAETAPIR